MSKRCRYVEKDGFHHCGSYAFNLAKDGIDQGELCDVHFWQARASKLESALINECSKHELEGFYDTPSHRALNY